LLVGAWWFSLRPTGGPGHLTVVFLDVGQGDATLLTTPNGTQILVDGGPSGIELARELGAVMPHWDRRIDYLLLTHPQQDHVAGLIEMGRRFHSAGTFESGATNSSATYRLYAGEFGTRESWRAGEQLTVDGVDIEVLWPPPGGVADDLNNTSLVLRVGYRGTVLLLTGDIEAEAQLELLAGGTALDADVLKVPHHGSASSEPQFFQAISPGLAIISVGADNRFGHPRPETVEALAPATVLRTDEDGRVTVRIDADGRLSYRTER
jgi:competence protein ComEC